MSLVRVKGGLAKAAWMRSSCWVDRWVGRLMVSLALFIMVGLANAQTVEYIHTDALGSPVATTNASGAVIERQVYEPYGAPISHGPTDGPGFTGHVEDSATGLTYMQQRYYDAEIQIFLSADPVGTYSSPVTMNNRYRYAKSNPYGFTDPDGRCPMPGSDLCGKSFETIVAQSGHTEDLRPPLTGAVTGSGWARPSSHPYVVGRDNTIVPPGPNPGLGKVIEDSVPAMHTMGTLHDNFVDFAVGRGIPDSIANIPSMPMAYQAAVLGEAANSAINVANRFLGTDVRQPFEHTHKQSSEDQRTGLRAAQSSGFRGVFRVEGRLDAKKLDKKI